MLPNRRYTGSYYFSILLASIVTLVGLVVIVGWFTHTVVLIQVLPYFVPMQFNTALGFLLCGLGFLLLILFLDNRLRMVGLCLGVVVALLGMLTLLEYISGINLGVDQLLMTHYVIIETSHPGRMAPNTALCFTLAGIVMVLFASSVNIKNKYLYLQLIILMISLLSSIALAGYFFEISTAYSWGNLTRMAVHTSVAFLLWSTSALCLLHDTLKQEGRHYDRAPLILFSIMALGSIVLWGYLAEKERHGVIQTIARLAPHLESRVQSILSLQKNALQRMVNRRKDHQVTAPALWTRDAKAYLEHNPAEILFAVLTPQGKLRWFQAREGQDATDLLQSLNLSLPQELKRSQRSLQPIVLAPKRLNYRYFGSWMIFPLQHAGKLEGYFVVFYDYQMLLQKAATPVTRQLTHLSWTYRQQLVYQHPFHLNTSQQRQWQQQFVIYINGYPFTLTLWPTKQLLNQALSWMPAAILVLGLVLAFTIATLLQFWQTLKTCKQQTALILESAGDGIYGLDNQGKTTFVNAAAASMLGYSPDELLNQPQHALIHHSYPDGTPYPREKCPIYAAFSDGQTHKVNTEVFWRKNGTSFPVAYKSRPIFDNGQLVGAVVSFRDITADMTVRKKIEQALKLRTAELEASNKELEAFSYSVSHDLRSPLRHISGFIDLLKKNSNSQLDDEGKHYVTVISNAVIKLGTLIDDLLQFSRTGRLALNKVTFPLAELISEVEEELSTLCQDRDIVVNKDSLPVVYADKELMRLVITNLLVNAIKFTQPRKKAIIQFNAQDSDGFYKFSVTDNGVGFDPEYADKIFDVFQRLHKSSEFEGTGIGLANVAKIIQRHGGSVSASSTLNQGATIYFTLPKHEEYLT